MEFFMDEKLLKSGVVEGGKSANNKKVVAGEKTANKEKVFKSDKLKSTGEKSISKKKEVKPRIGFAITGSFCTIDEVLKQIENLKKHFDVMPILSFNASGLKTRATDPDDVISRLEKLTGNKVATTLQEAEAMGPNGYISAIVIAPCTGTTLSKLANAISDTPVTMTAKSLMRNNKPVIIGISTNDGLGLNMQNIAKLIVVNGVYFVPFWQDDYLRKPKSLVANWEKISETVMLAMKGEQLEPVLCHREIELFK
jgi:dipicolinate synthase subunit B